MNVSDNSQEVTFPRFVLLVTDLQSVFSKWYCFEYLPNISECTKTIVGLLFGNLPLTAVSIRLHVLALVTRAYVHGRIYQLNDV